jgi:hypothetical protein
VIRGLGYLGMKYVHTEKQDIEFQKHKYKYVLTASNHMKQPGNYYKNLHDSKIRWS